MTRMTDAAVCALQDSQDDNGIDMADSMPGNVIKLTEEDFARVHERIEAGEPVEDFYRRAVRTGIRGGEPTCQAEDNHDTARCDVGTASPFGVEAGSSDLEGVRGGQEVQRKPLSYRFIKRAFDIVFSACVIAVGFLPGLVLSIFIVADTKGSPIYLSTRTGAGGRYFRILKFRTMVADSDDLEKYFTPEQIEQWHREHKVDDDPRITRLGAFLRSTSIDEFPQFINVLLGQMSTVGCRAITDEEIAHFGSGQDLLLSMRPGITGMWQTGPRNIATFESGIRQKLDLSYIANASVKLDAKIILRTFRAMAERTGK